MIGRRSLRGVTSRLTLIAAVLALIAALRLIHLTCLNIIGLRLGICGPLFGLRLLGVRIDRIFIRSV